MIKDLIAQVRAKLSDEEVSKVDSLLSQAVREESSILDDLSAANHESKTRKEKIRELNSQIEGSGDKDADFKAKLAAKDAEIEKLKGIETKFNEYQESEFTKAKSEFDKVLKGLSVKETDPKFEQYKKVLDKFKLETKEQPLTQSDINANLGIYNLAKELGGLDIKENDLDEGKTPKGRVIQDKDDPLSVFGNK